MKRLLLLICSLFAFSIGYAEPGNVNEAWVVTLNTTTFTALPQARKIWAFNPDVSPILISSSTASPAAKRFTLKAKTYAPWPLESASNWYALSGGTGTLVLELLLVK